MTALMLNWFSKAVLLPFLVRRFNGQPRSFINNGAIISQIFHQGLLLAMEETDGSN
jgi:hypothetical protein